MACELERIAVGAARHALTVAINGGDLLEIRAAQRRLLAAELALRECLADPPVAAPLTLSAPAMTTAGEHVYLFAVNEAGRVVYTRWVLGGSVEPWHEVPGGFQTNQAVAASAVGDYLFLVAKGIDDPDRLFLNQGVPPTWVGWGELG